MFITPFKGKHMESIFVSGIDKDFLKQWQQKHFKNQMD